MKKTLLIALLLIPFWGFSQTTKPIDSFLGIKFGSNRAVVTTALKAKGATVSTTNTDTTRLVFNNLKLGSRNVEYLSVYFVNDQVAYVLYFLLPPDEAHEPSYYQDLVNDFNGVYGPGASTKKYIDPYSEGESSGDELLGLSVNKVTYQTLWKDADQNKIMVKTYHHADDALVGMQIFYLNSVLFKQYSDNQKAKNSKDY